MAIISNSPTLEILLNSNTAGKIVPNSLYLFRLHNSVPKLLFSFNLPSLVVCRFQINNLAQYFGLSFPPEKIVK